MMLTQTARWAFSRNKEKIIKCVREVSRPCSFFSSLQHFHFCYVGIEGLFGLLLVWIGGSAVISLKKIKDRETLSPHPSPLHPTPPHPASPRLILPHPASLSAPGTVVCMSLKGRWHPVQAALPLPSKPFKVAPSKAHNVLHQRHIRVLEGGDSPARRS